MEYHTGGQTIYLNGNLKLIFEVLLL
jgi:hypothetical protein